MLFSILVIIWYRERVVISEIEAITVDVRRNEPFPIFPRGGFSDVSDKLSLVTFPDLAKCIHAGITHVPIFFH